jgi:CDP-paratose 2-epimerase
MNYKKVLITGGAGFVGSSIGVKLKEHYTNVQVLALDNLIRKGSELNLPRLEEYGIKFIKGDVREKEDLNIKGVDLLIECSAEPSVMAGVTSSPEYLLETNLWGAVNCFEMARKEGTDVVFLSTSRVYPVHLLNSLDFVEKETRFEFSKNQKVQGASEKGISEDFSLDGPRTLYGTTKLSAEFLLQEYIENYKIRGIIDRFGLISGPWQMGKVDQGVIVLWMARHYFKKNIRYIGFGGEGKQVRDVINIDDLFALLNIQIENIDKFSGLVHNVGGGSKNSISLLELTGLCQEITGNKVQVKKIKKTRPGDVKSYISNNSKILEKCLELGYEWTPRKTVKTTLLEIHEWIKANNEKLKNILE